MIKKLHSFPLFQRFQREWEPLLSTVAIRSFSKDSIIASHGEQANTVWLVVKGWVSLHRHTPDGRNITVGLCTSGDLFGEAGLFSQANYPYTAQVIEQDTELVVIPAPTLRQLTQHYPSLSNYLMELLSERLARTQLTLEQMSSLTAAQRLGCFLLRLCDAHEDTKLTLPIDKHIVASYLGMKPETLSRSFQQLQPLGIQVNLTSVHIEDVARLRHYVCDHCGESGMCATEEKIIS